MIEIKKKKVWKKATEDLTKAEAKVA